jgi:hypothetical protein
MYTGGDILEITYNHPTVGSGSLFCKAAEDGTLKRGGYQSVDDDANITGDGRRIDQINRVPWSFEAPPIAWDMTNVDEQDKLVEMAGSPLEANWTINVVNGAIYGGTGKPVGEIPGNTNNAQVTLKLSGSGKLKKIS